MFLEWGVGLMKRDIRRGSEYYVVINIVLKEERLVEHSLLCNSIPIVIFF